MPELDESQTTDDKSDDALIPAQDELLSDLPDDPAERTKELENRVILASREQRRTQAENERLARERDEQKTRGDFWFDETNKLKEPPATMHRNGADAAKTKKLAPVDLAEFVGDEETGYERLVTKIKADLNLMTRDEFDTERQNERTAAHRSAAIQNQLTEEYPDLASPKSALRSEATKQFEALEREHPTWETEAIAELAVTRAARKIGTAAKKPDADLPDGEERARNAFGSTGRRTTGGKVTGQVDDRLRQTVSRTAGEQLPEDVLKRIADNVAKNQEAARRQRA